MTTAETIPKYPALKRLGSLAEFRPVVVVDTREQTPLIFSRLETVEGGLQTGDYSFLGGETVLAVERKSVPDLVACCVNSNRGRFERELHRLRGYRFARVLVVGSRDEIERGEYRSGLSPKVVLHSIAAFEARYGIPFVFIDDPTEAARQVETWVYWSAREIVEAANTLLRGHKA